MVLYECIKCGRKYYYEGIAKKCCTPATVEFCKAFKWQGHRRIGNVDINYSIIVVDDALKHMGEAWDRQIAAERAELKSY